MYSVHLPESTLLNLPGRDVRVFIGADHLSSDRMTMGMTEVPPETAMPGHVHDDKEEHIFVFQGYGEALVGESVERLEPFTAVLFPVGIPHQVKSIGPEPLRFVFVFNPVHDFGGLVQPKNRK